jgi:DNA gyrase subunit A
VTAGGFGKRIATREFRTQARGGRGVVALKFKKRAATAADNADADSSSSGNKEERMVCLRAVRDSDEILVITARGVMVRLQVGKIPAQHRTGTGVRLQRLDGGDRISSVSVVPECDEEGGEFD